MKKVAFKDTKVSPCKIICVGRNYVEHIKELGNELPKQMVLFIKPNSSIGDDFLYVSEDNHYEGEISFLIKDGGIYAVGFGLDITKRELQSILKEKGLPWERAKAFDNSAVFSDFVKIEDTNGLSLELYKNGELIQQGGVELMIYKPEQIIKEIKTFLSLDDYDIVMSGTPKGVGKYKIGDKFLGKIYKEDKLLTQKEWIVK
ncbi:MAG: fumarylacetoacetate hydrolase family protein [Epsilonproteobacteria bacterium]|nr:fumarylacetoacetate hydrolase family protein [Campylobacterota bacterium]